MRLNGVFAQLMPIHPPSFNGAPIVNGTIVNDGVVVGVQKRGYLTYPLSNPGRIRGQNSTLLVDSWQTIGRGLGYAIGGHPRRLSRGHHGGRPSRKLIDGSAKPKDVLIRVVLNMH